MGAGNSKPQTAHIINSHPQIIPIDLTPSVVRRLEHKRIEATLEDSSIIKQIPYEHTPMQEESSILEEKAEESEKEGFDEAMEKFDEEPPKWTDNIKQDMNRLRAELIQCYNDNPKETLKCEKTATEFKNLIFNEQYFVILKAKGLPTDEQRKYVW